jgi:hypothetical protein
LGQLLLDCPDKSIAAIDPQFNTPGGINDRATPNALPRFIGEKITKNQDFVGALSPISLITTDNLNKPAPTHRQMIKKLPSHNPAADADTIALFHWGKNHEKSRFCRGSFTRFFPRGK